MELADPLGRVVTDLRIALTRDCNLSCFFCHKEGASPGAAQMTPAEVERLVRIGARLGVRTIKLTGGEPLLRTDLEEIVKRMRPHVAEISLVTNGIGFGKRAAALSGCGLDRVNLSLHGLDAKVPLHASEALQSAGNAVRAAQANDLAVKVNFVVTRQNLHLVPDLIDWAQDVHVPLQLIELHANPRQWPLLEPSFASLENTERFLQGKTTRIESHRLHARPIYHLPKGPVEITRPMNNWKFCAGCQRLRVTADGMFQTCLLTPKFLDLLGPMRRGCTDEHLEALYREAASLRQPTWTAPPAGVQGQPEEVTAWH